MLKNVKELKEFIKWAKANKIKNFKHGDISFELSDLAFVETTDYSEITDFEKKQLIDTDETDLTEQELEERRKEDEELLFWSANN